MPQDIYRILCHGPEGDDTWQWLGNDPPDWRYSSEDPRDSWRTLSPDLAGTVLRTCQRKYPFNHHRLHKKGADDMKEVSRNITVEMVEDALESSVFDTDYISYCILCGAEHQGFEPDTRGAICDHCNDEAVYSVEELVLWVGPDGDLPRSRILRDRIEAEARPWWEDVEGSWRPAGSCHCDSGEECEEISDARGIYVATVCDQCRERKLSGFRQSIFADPGYDADEPIEPEEEF